MMITLIKKGPLGLLYYFMHWLFVHPAHSKPRPRPEDSYTKAHKH